MNCEYQSETDFLVWRVSTHFWGILNFNMRKNACLVSCDPMIFCHNIREKINYVILNSPIINDDRLGSSYSRNRTNSNWVGGRWDFTFWHSSDIFRRYACSFASMHVHRV